MKKNDLVVCTTDKFNYFTKGRKYKLLSDRNGTIIDIINDIGDRCYPSYYGVNSPLITGLKALVNNENIIFYFKSIEDNREEIINQVLR